MRKSHKEIFEEYLKKYNAMSKAELLRARDDDTEKSILEYRALHKAIRERCGRGYGVQACKRYPYAPLYISCIAIVVFIVRLLFA